MNQDLELMRQLLLWVADASQWELAYREQQASLTEDGSIDKKNEYNRRPGTSLEGGHYTVINFRPLPEQGTLFLGRESARNQFLRNGIYDDGRPRHEEYSVSGGDKETVNFYVTNTFLPAGFPLQEHWMGRSQFEVTYNCNQLDLAGHLRVRYFHTEQEWITEPPVSMYLTPKGADFVAFIRDKERWESLRHGSMITAPRQGLLSRIKRWNGGASQAVKTVDGGIQTISILSNKASQMTELIQNFPLG